MKWLGVLLANANVHSKFLALQHDKKITRPDFIHDHNHDHDHYYDDDHDYDEDDHDEDDKHDETFDFPHPEVIVNSHGFHWAKNVDGCRCARGKFWNPNTKSCVDQQEQGYECGFFPRSVRHRVCVDGYSCQALHGAEDTYEDDAHPATCECACKACDASCHSGDRHANCVVGVVISGDACATVDVRVQQHEQHTDHEVATATSDTIGPDATATAGATATAHATEDARATVEKCVSAAEALKHFGHHVGEEISSILAEQITREAIHHLVHEAREDALHKAAEEAGYDAKELASKEAEEDAEWKAQRKADARAHGMDPYHNYDDHDYDDHDHDHDDHDDYDHDDDDHHEDEDRAEEAVDDALGDMASGGATTDTMADSMDTSSDGGPEYKQPPKTSDEDFNKNKDFSSP